MAKRALSNASKQILANPKIFNQNFEYLQVLAYNRFENIQIQQILTGDPNHSRFLESGVKPATFNLENATSTDHKNINNKSNEILQNLNLEKYIILTTKDDKIPDEWKHHNLIDLSSTESRFFPLIYSDPDQLHEHVENLSTFFSSYTLENEEINQIITECPELIFDYHKWKDMNLLKFRTEKMIDRNIFPFFKKDIKLNLKSSSRNWLIYPLVNQVGKLMYLMKDMHLVPPTYGSGRKRKRTKLFQGNYGALHIMYGGLLNFDLFHIQSRHQFLLRRGQYQNPTLKGLIEGGDKKNPSPISVIQKSDRDFLMQLCNWPEDQIEEGLAEFEQFCQILQQEYEDNLEIEIAMESSHQDYVNEEALFKEGYNNRQANWARLNRPDMDLKLMKEYLNQRYEEEDLSENFEINSAINSIRDDL